MFNKEIKNIQTIIANYPMLQVPVANIVAEIINQEMTGKFSVKEAKQALKQVTVSLKERIQK
jgi:hypothetical protein